MDRKAIGKRIQQQREAARLSQEKLAEKVNLSTNFISAVERGIKTPSLENFIHIANALEVPSDTLLIDVLKVGYKIKSSLLEERLQGLSKEEQQRIFAAVDALTNRTTKP